jgi:outer membrane protein assembly factor BamB
MKPTFLRILVSSLALTFAVRADTPLVFEDLGNPVVQKTLSMRCVTRDAAGMLEAWAAFESPDRFALVGVGLDDGKITWVEINRFGAPPTSARHPQMVTGADGNLYAFVGVPGHFIRYDVTKRKLTDLGAPSPDASYWLGSELGPDGKFYLGTYPKTELVRCDPTTGRVENLGRLTEDDRLVYVAHPVASDDGVIYCPVGAHHGELWAYDTRASTRRQILPEAMTTAQGWPEVWRGSDGRVYGERSGKKFRCTPTSIVLDETSKRAQRSNPRAMGDLFVGDIGEDGKLAITRGAKTTHVATDFTGVPRLIYSVSCERQGRIYGGTVAPARAFSFDPATRKLTDHGQFTGGPVQIYDTINHERGLFLASYMNASVDLFDPDAPLKNGENPRRIVTLDGHERPVQEIIAADGLIYTGTTPSKGRLGGALLRVNPADLTHRVWQNIMPNQSIQRLTSMPQTGEILGVTSIYGGSSAIPTEKEAELFLWDCKQEKVVFKTAPLPGIKLYTAVVATRNGLVYGTVYGSNKFYAFDPVARKTVFTGTLPVRSLHFPDLADEPFGPRGLIYGIGDDALIAIDPSDHSVKVLGHDPALKRTHGFCISQDGFLYFGSGSHLMRCKLPPQN